MLKSFASVQLISDISAKCIRSSLRNIPSSVRVQLESSDCFRVPDFPEIRGHIPSTHGQMVQGLLDEESLTLYASCTVHGEPTARQVACMLDVTLYGPFELSEELGSWLQEYDIFLQDPQTCHLDVRYCNPQRLSSDDMGSCPMLVQFVARSSGRIHLQAIAEGPNLLDMLDNNVDLEESPQPRSIRTTLKRHQKQALTFMLRREQERHFDTRQPSIWEAIDTDYSRHFLNRVSNADQLEEPRQFYGGIIADPMGFGKTLTMIALVGSDSESLNVNTTFLDMMDVDEDDPDVATTLIVVPPPLLDTWEEQLAEHVHDGQLSFHRHHGKSRLSKTEDIGRVNILLTTYHTVSADWKTGKSVGQSPLFSVRWRRIILDEAHVIRNGNSGMAKAACSLNARFRWAVTGTPIQNRLGDLASLLKFTRVHPYDDTKRFDADISHLWKSGDNGEAIKRLKRLAVCLLLRRPKQTVCLPPRQDMRCCIEFTRAERDEYDKIRRQAITRIDEALDQDSEVVRSGVYVNVLQQIESLRLFCNMGLHYHSRHEQWNLKRGTDWSSVAQHDFDLRREMGPIICFICFGTIDLTDTLLHDPTTKHSFSRCMKLTCSECLQKLEPPGRLLECGHNPPCPSAFVSLSSIAIDGTEIVPSAPARPIGLPSKVAALVEDIKNISSDLKCVVFSSWRLTLDIVAAGLEQAGIRSIRFDGKVPQKGRQTVVDRFRNDADVQVMLLTLNCGAAGLTLTVASRAYLIEPHWNPSLEEQALARIHRLGQTREVTTIRFFIRDSIEEELSFRSKMSMYNRH
ncbi:hypothetical protein XA68_14768 [Ophiocordyceps unilateralis]|uniref:Helicase ATP-binding domain-containing protein n=1 Tax=Ophiocordyceps unilateralis TaxID=268505 RepID=A0A2A9P871_OPHUN|nr:hypothetical protein XA68_14768 [Ophiocordyceps unilateralis]